MKPKCKTLKLLTRAEARKALEQGKVVVGFHEQTNIEFKTIGLFFGTGDLGECGALWGSCYAFVLWPEKEGNK